MLTVSYQYATIQNLFVDCLPAVSRDVNEVLIEGISGGYQYYWHSTADTVSTPDPTCLASKG